ncbi:hypothetical protein BOTBODRAFT_170785 [Botryobasidium botryosum FD-172 SS1]|uniref:Nitrogen permease regulator 3 n=1 Tax=Botryobasidium botryosum (strain FD-172 SS1) TaxID=930990 RepID=A0A067N4T3_BOTB1|nr:hypothetical protein BOTBODRAFT_170785 [Botryobasidium botryosum FD-172 SS1]
MHNLLGILLVSSSSSGSTLAFHWPPDPHPAPRLVRPKPPGYSQRAKLLDTSWRFAQGIDDAKLEDVLQKLLELEKAEMDDYEWKAPATRPSLSHSRDSAAHIDSNNGGGGGGGGSSSHSTSHSLSQDTVATSDLDDMLAEKHLRQEYDHILGFKSSILAELLSPKHALCHQKFELIVDEMAFIGHPVHIDSNGSWSWDELHAAPPQPDPRATGRGRSTRRFSEGSSALDDDDIESLTSPSPRPKSPAAVAAASQDRPSQITSFHLVLVLDRPDPCSTSSVDLYRYIDSYYWQIVFKMTAAMHYEQGRDDFIGEQCKMLTALRENCMIRGEPIITCMQNSVAASPLAAAIRDVYTAVTSGGIAHIAINEIMLTVQLPPNLDALLKPDPDVDPKWSEDPSEKAADAETQWEEELRSGWGMAPLQPWKTLLLFDGQDPMDIPNSIAGKPDSDESDPEDMLRKFIAMADPKLSLSEIATLLELDLNDEIYPMARLLVYHRKAKVIDVVNPDLKNIYAPPAKFDRPLQELTTIFSRAFPSVPLLPELLSTLSSSHRPFSSIVPSRDHRTLFFDVLIWLLKRDLLVMLHVHVRIVATADIKRRVRDARKREEEDARRRRTSRRPRRSDVGLNIDFGGVSRSRRLSSPSSAEKPAFFSKSRSPRRRSFGAVDMEEIEIAEKESELNRPSWSKEDEDLTPSLIPDPARATALERRWMDTMAVDKEPSVSRRFKKLAPFFDGKHTTNEILHRTDMSKRDVREVLHQFEDYLLVFLHP